MTWSEVKSFAESEYKSGRIIGKEYATFLLGALQTQMQIDADAAVKAAQIASMQIEDNIKQVQSTKDLAIKDAQIAQSASQKALLDQQKLTEVQQTAKLTYDIQNILPSQKALLDQQKLTEVQKTTDLTYKNTTLSVDEHNLNLKKIELTNSQKLQADRQTVAFDDKKRVEQATQAGGLVGMIYASGGDVPTDAWTYAKGKVDAI